MKKRLPNNQKTKEYLASLRKVYFVGVWAGWGYREHYFAGDFVVEHDRFQPLVWDYDDHNGTDDAYYLRPIEFTTTGCMYTWTFDEHLAQDIVRYKRGENAN